MTRPLLLALAAPASAIDHPLGGRRLVLRQGAKSERLVLVARDIRMTTPARGASDDPTLRGAVLHVGNPETGEWARFELAAAGWTEAQGGLVFRFRNRQARGAGSEVRALSLRDRKRLRIRAQRIGITLDEPSQRSMAVVLTSGSQRWCTLFGGTVRKDQPGRFAARNAVPPAACPEPVDATGGSTTTSSSTSSSSTSTSTTSTSSTSTSSTSSTSTTSTSSTSSVSSTSSSTTSTSSTSTTSTSSTSTSTSSPSSSTSSTSSSSTSTSSSTTSSSSSSTSSTSTSSTSSSTTTSTVSTCGGFLICGGTCPPERTCSGIPCACRP